MTVEDVVARILAWVAYERGLKAFAELSERDAAIITAYADTIARAILTEPRA